MIKNALPIVETCLHFAELDNRTHTNKIVVHHSATPDTSAAKIHQSHLDIGYAGIGYHFVVRENGAIERGRPLWAVGAHTYGANSDSVGICLAGDFQYVIPFHFQFESAALLIAWLCDHFNLPCDRQHIFAHRELYPTLCPGDSLYNELDTLVGKANWYLR